LAETQPHFANARSLRNALDRARLRQASRLFAMGRPVSVDDLCTIEADDILKSRVFAQASGNGAGEPASPDAAMLTPA
jgi:hypothetical protein